MIARLFLVCVLCSGCLLAKRSRSPEGEQNTTVAANTTEGGEQKKEDKLVCRRERVTGSHFKKRVCRYESERKAESQATQDRLRHSGNVNAPPGPES